MEVLDQNERNATFGATIFHDLVVGDKSQVVQAKSLRNNRWKKAFHRIKMDNVTKTHKNISGKSRKKLTKSWKNVFNRVKMANSVMHQFGHSSKWLEHSRGYRRAREKKRMSLSLDIDCAQTVSSCSSSEEDTEMNRPKTSDTNTKSKIQSLSNLGVDTKSIHRIRQKRPSLRAEPSFYFDTSGIFTHNSGFQISPRGLRDLEIQGNFRDNFTSNTKSSDLIQKQDLSSSQSCTKNTGKIKRKNAFLFDEFSSSQNQSNTNNTLLEKQIQPTELAEGEYAPLGVLGKGCCGVVVKALHVPSLRVVAIKEVSIYKEQAMRHQLLAELRSLSFNIISAESVQKNPCWNCNLQFVNRSRKVVTFGRHKYSSRRFCSACSAIFCGYCKRFKMKRLGKSAHT